MPGITGNKMTGPDANKTINSQYEEVLERGKSSTNSGMSAGIEHAKPDNITHPATGTVSEKPYKNPQNDFNKVYAKPNHKNQNDQ